MQETTVNTNVNAYAPENDVVTIDLGEIFSALLSKIRIILIITVIAGMIGFVVSDLIMAPTYNSTTSIYVLNKRGESLTVSDTQLATQLTKDYAKLITGRKVLETVLANVGSDESYESFKSRVRVSNEKDTRILEITVTDESPRVAQQLANAIRAVATEHIKSVTDVEAINVAEEANLPGWKSGPNVKMYTALGALLGFAISAGFVLLKFLLDDTVKSSEDIEKYLGLSTIALVPDSEKVDGKEKTKKSGLFSKKEKKKPAKSGSSRIKF